MRRSFSVTMFVGLLSLNSEALAQAVCVEIPSAPLIDSLQRFSRETGAQVVINKPLAEDQRSRPYLGCDSKGEILLAILPPGELNIALNGDAYILTPSPPKPVTPVRRRAALQPSPSPELLIEDAIVVQGYFLQNERSVARKQAEDLRVAEVIAQDDLGQLPDFNVADAARRAVGVFTLFDEDEGRFVSIRGLSPNETFATLDGGAVPSLEPQTRAVNFENIPVTAIDRIEVFKTSLAENDANATGGTLNLVTRSAFNATDTYFSVQGFVGNYSFDDIPRADHDTGVSARIDGTASTRFGESNAFGFLLSANWSRKDRDEFKYRPRSRYVVNNGNIYSTGQNYAASDLLETRLGALAKLEYHPGEDFYASLRLNYFNLDSDEIRHDTRVDASGQVTFLSPTRLSSTEAEVDLLSIAFPISRKTIGGQITVYKDFNNGDRVDGFLALNRAERDEQQRFSTFSAQGSASRFQTDTQSDIPSLVFDLSDQALQPSSFLFDGAARNRLLSEQTIHEAGLNITKKLTPIYPGLSLKTGFLIRDTDQSHAQTGIEVDYAGPVVRVEPFLLPSEIRASSVSFPQYAFDHRQAIAFSDQALFENGVPVNDAGITFNGNVVETIAAGYGRVLYEAANLKLSAGLRYETSDSKITAIGDVDSAPETVFRSNSFDGFLPSASARYDFGDGWRLKGAYSRTFGRPDFADYLPGERRDSVSREKVAFNDALAPSRADNLDLGLEYYFDNEMSLFSIAYFNKQIDGVIFSTSQKEIINGEEFTVRSPRNSGNASINGLEVGLIKNRLNIIPILGERLGVNLNYTHSVGKLNTPDRAFSRLIDQPRHLFNAALLYSAGSIDGRVAINYASSHLASIGACPTEDIYFDAHTQLDMQLRYHVTDKWVLQFEGRNLTDENRVERRDLDGPLNDETEYGRSLWVGFSYTR